MSGQLDRTQKVIPGQLSFLAIYNPSLGDTDETVRQQIVYYGSRAARDGRIQTRSNEDKESEEEENERLRQVGLAQGMVDFVKNFSNGAPIDSIETEKSRLVLHELESGWWILASIELTRLPPTRAAASSDDKNHSSIEYSSREVSPAQLLVKQLIQAHSIFLLHHAPTLQELFNRLGRTQFCSLLERFWNTFTRDWDVLLHGNPAVNIYNGVKLAGGGELGVGVGEEEWGSGEREVLEDFVSRTDGLVDIVVSRFGDAPDQPGPLDTGTTPTKNTSRPEPWLGTDNDARSSDGVIFSGVGSMSRRSLVTVSQWIEAIFKNGEAAYGVGENPGSRHRRRNRRASPKPSSGHARPTQEVHPRVHSPRGRPPPDLRRKALENNATPPGIPPPLVVSVERSLDQAIATANARGTSKSPRPAKSDTETTAESSMFDSDKMMKYLKLGYGSAWTLSPAGLAGNDTKEPKTSMVEENADQIPGKTDSHEIPNAVSTENDEPLQYIDPTPEATDDDEPHFVQRLEQSNGKFIIGLFGDLENAEFDRDDAVDEDGNQAAQKAQKSPRILLRTITVEKSGPKVGDGSLRTLSLNSGGSKPKNPHTSAGDSIDGAQGIVTHQKVQVAVYVHQPFIFAFLFDLHTPSLTMPTFYRNIHHQLGPLQKPLLRSTDPSKVAERIADAMGGSSSTTSPVQAGVEGPRIYDIIYDPIKLTIRASIPNIPLPGSLAAEGLASRASSVTVSGSWYTLGIPLSGGTSSPSSGALSNLVKTEWTRVEALNVHTQVLNTWAATRNGMELERTVKTGRGWWVLWMQVPSPSGDHKEAFLVRKAGDHKAVMGKGKDSSSGKWLLRDQTRDTSGSSTRSAAAGNTHTAAGVSEGVGVDARKWVEGLLHFV